MNKRKWTIWLSAGLLIILAVTGYFAIAAEVGSKQDPLVTLSYIDVIAADTMDKIDAEFAAKKSELDAQIDAKLSNLTVDIDKRIAEYKTSLASENLSDEMMDAIADVVMARMLQEGVGSGTSTETPSGGGTASSWKVVSLNAGQTLTGQVGCEIILRIGAATCTASGSPGLINLSDGTDLANGGALRANNLYIVTINGRGFTAGADGCTVVVSGSYSIS